MWSDLTSKTFRATLDELLRSSHACRLAEMPGAAEAYLSWNIARITGRTVLWIGDGPKTLQSMHQDLLTLAPAAATLLYFPSLESLPAKRAGATDTDSTGDRLSVLVRQASAQPLTVVATCVQALMQLTLSRQALVEYTAAIATGSERDPAELARFLESLSYQFLPEVQAKGQAAVRGGILDVWPPTEPWPVRLDFLGSTVESIRAFDPIDQRSRDRLDRVAISPVSETGVLRRESTQGVSLLDHLSEESVLVWSRDDRIRAHAAVYEETVAEAHAARTARSLASLDAEVARRSGLRQLFVGGPGTEDEPVRDLGFQPLQGAVPPISDVLQPDIMEAARRKFLKDLVQRARHGQAVHVFFDTQGTLDRFRSTLSMDEVAETIRVSVGALSEGFANEEAGVTLVAESDLYGKRKSTQGRYDAHGRRAGPAPVEGARISDWTDIEPGDLVVHVEHGIGRYIGLREILFNGQIQEVLGVEYANQARLYVPVSQAHLLSRYVGVGKRHRPLHQLGGHQWTREKAAAERSIQDLASSLLETQAARDALSGHAFAADTAWEHEFEAAFPYRETEDQEQAIRNVKGDMQSSRPMDRLVCGDAGYGKTEVAMRAAFKAVMCGKQVAVLVPTTVLAQQHFYTFRDRMSAYPVRIEMLSRFCSRPLRSSIVESIKDGTVDIVIGTHGLLQPSIQFKDLGLVIIDEEQRFGVLHKEKFKHLRRLVDVLTLTATPIPRTLYMSLMGARDLSTIQTPPQERLTIETTVALNTDEVIREAILRELNREGQVYYLHNRVKTIDRVRARLAQLVPECRIDVAHGQLPSSELARVMQRFAKGECDVLLCTTIVESGMDIPNANTILIDRADRFGMAELYQLRGRVGRSKRKAYACMLLPAHGYVDPTARKRIQAIKQYTDHGAGFRLAMRDLEIRGAGNLLGTEQSGHIAVVGFALYCQLLKRTVAGLKGEAVAPVVDVDVKLDFIDLSPAAAGTEASAVIPSDYIEDERLRIRAYRRIAEAASLADIRKVRGEFQDRFGRIGRALDRLLKIAEIRIAAAERGVTSVEVKEDKLVLVGRGGYVTKGGLFPRLKKTGPDARLDEILHHVRHAA